MGITWAGSYKSQRHWPTSAARWLRALRPHAAPARSRIPVGWRDRASVSLAASPVSTASGSEGPSMRHALDALAHVNAAVQAELAHRGSVLPDPVACGPT